MEKINGVVKVICPQCSNIFNSTIQKNNIIKGQCPVCKAVIFSKQHNERETRMNIIKA